MITKLLKLGLAFVGVCLMSLTALRATSIYFTFEANSGDGVWSETLGSPADNPDETGIDLESPGVYAYTKSFNLDLGTADLWCEANTNGMSGGIYYVGTFPDGGSDIYVSL